MSSFFLDSDDAKSLGDIDYMRKAKRIRRTFPKTAGQPEEQEIEREISAMTVFDEKGKVSTVSGPATPESEIAPTFSKATENGTNGATFGGVSDFQSEATQTRRKTDTSMDMFRNMAKKIGK
jgi:hypothetical protein